MDAPYSLIKTRLSRARVRGRATRTKRRQLTRSAPQHPTISHSVFLSDYAFDPSYKMTFAVHSLSSTIGIVLASSTKDIGDEQWEGGVGRVIVLRSDDRDIRQAVVRE